MNEVLLTDLLLARAGPKVTRAYADALQSHYWLWRWLGTSNADTLGTIRRILVDHRLLEANASADWIVSRGRDEYAAALGMEFENSLDANVREALLGHLDPTAPPIWMDSGAGNGTALYEFTRPWVRGVGTGLSLLFDIGGTVRNWLVEEFRGEVIQGYRSETLQSTLLAAEILSVASFAAWPKSPIFDPFTELGRPADETDIFEAADLVRIRERTKEAIADLAPRGADTAAAIALGFLVDALVGRATAPNPAGFYYERPELSSIALAEVQRARQNFSALASARALPAESDLADVFAVAKRHVADITLSPSEDEAFTDRLADFGDRIKGLAFELRRTTPDVHLPAILHDVGNALWSWHFFLKDHERWSRTAATRLPAREAVRDVRRWLERPWGLISPDDLKITLGGSPSDEHLPELVGPLMPLLVGGYNNFRKSLDRPRNHAESALTQLITHRCVLRDVRVSRVRHSASNLRDLAAIVVDIASLWFERLSQEEQHAMVDAGLEPFCDAIKSGRCLTDVRTSESLPMLSRKQHALLQQYANSPEHIAKRLFEFTADGYLVDRLDVFPPEVFYVILK